MFRLLMSLQARADSQTGMVGRTAGVKTGVPPLLSNLSAKTAEAATLTGGICTNLVTGAPFWLQAYAFGVLPY